MNKSQKIYFFILLAATVLQGFPLDEDDLEVKMAEIIASKYFKCTVGKLEADSGLAASSVISRNHVN